MSSRKIPPLRESQQQNTGSTKKTGDSQTQSRAHTFKTPGSNPKLVPSGSGSRPDLNATGLGPSTKTKCKSVPSLNQSLMHHFDVKPALKKPESVDIRQVVEREAPRDFAEANVLLDYNNYLQALGQQCMVKSLNIKHENSINEIFIVLLSRLDELKEVLKEVVSKVALIDKKTAVMEHRDLLRGNVEIGEQVLARNEPLVTLSGLLKVFDTASANLSLINIKTIHSQEEFEKFISTMENLNTVLERIVSTINDRDEVNLLATKIKNFMKVHNEIKEIRENMLKTKIMAQQLLLKESSDMFAKMS